MHTVDTRRGAFADRIKSLLQPIDYNSVTWSQAENGDPLLCVSGSGSNLINVFNVTTKQLVTVCVSPLTHPHIADSYVVQTLAGHGDVSALHYLEQHILMVSFPGHKRSCGIARRPDRSSLMQR
jgi:hypothetical protein